MNGYAGSSSPAVKRLAAELREMHRKPSLNYTAEPLEDELFEWHFTIAGPPDTAFEGGRFHGRIVMPPDYPMKPPDVYLSTPNGRFETNTKICLSYTSFHPEEWQPAWGVRTMLDALTGIFPLDQPGVGALTYSDEERKMLAKESLRWTCPVCSASMAGILPNAPCGGGAKNAPADRCLPATPPAPAKADATASTASTTTNVSATPSTMSAPTPATATAAPAAATTSAKTTPAVAAADAMETKTATSVTSQPPPSTAPTPTLASTVPTPAATAAPPPAPQAVAPQTDLSLYFIYGLVFAIVALLVKKLSK